MQDGQALGIVEAACDLSRTGHDVMRDIARAAARAITSGPVGVAYVDRDGRLDPASVYFERSDEHRVAQFLAWQHQVDGKQRRHALALAPCVAALHTSDHVRSAAELGVMTHRLFPVCVMANTGHGDSLCILCDPCMTAWLSGQLQDLEAVAHHLAVAWRIRTWLDAPGAAPREALRGAVLAQDRPRPGRRPSQLLWPAMLAGRWSLLEAFPAGGARHLVAVENPDTTARLRALPPREHVVLELALAGRSGKWIAYELQLSESTVARLLRMALRRIGAGDTAALAGVRTAMFDRLEAPGVALAMARVAPATASGELSAAERSIVSGLLGGKRVAAIARERGTSPRTVSNQLASAYRKLGVSSRREVIALLA